MSQDQKLVLGIDVGGTNVKLGIIGPDGAVTARRRLSTRNVMSTREQLISAMIDAVRTLWKDEGLDAAQFAGIGIGLPGLINPRDGIVIFLPNIPGWEDVPLAGIFAEALGLPTFLENDVNQITLAEWQFGAARGVQDVICLTLGTGVGGGLILNGGLYRGAGFTAGELGHMPLNESGPQCNCGGIACLESYIGNRPLQQRAAQMTGRPDMTLEDMTQAGRDGESTAVEFWREAGTRLGQGLIGVVNLLNPQMVVVGGGVADGGGRHLLAAAEAQVRARAMMVQGKMVQFANAQLGSDAGIIGARVLVLQELNVQREK